MRSLVILLLLLPQIASAGSLHDVVGKKFWIKETYPFAFYENCGSSEIEILKSQGFVIDKISDPAPSGRRDAYVTMDGGMKACVDLDKLFKRDEYLYREDPAKMYKVKHDAFSKLGIKKGATVWLRYPHYNLAGLSKLTILQTEASENYLTVHFENVVDVFNEAKAFTDLFFLKNPEKSFSKRALKAIQEGTLFIGMTEKEVLASWGPPEKVNRTVSQAGSNEQWVYPDYTYVYIRNGKMTSWQDTINK